LKSAQFKLQIGDNCNPRLRCTTPGGQEYSPIHQQTLKKGERMISIRPLAMVFACLTMTANALGADGNDIFSDSKLISRGVNFGNALEAPNEGEWGVTLKEEYFEAIARAGFNSVRIPIRWSAHAGNEAPYTIDAKFFERIDWAIEQALSRKLAVIINVHHYAEMDRDPEACMPRFLGLWKQIAERYRQKSDRLIFEVLNEPHEKLTEELWNDMIPQALKIIRAANPRRAVIVGPGHWNSIHSLAKLSLPEDDRRLIVTFHYYEPYHFTHQGAPWDPQSAKWKGTTWTGTEKEQEDLRQAIEKAAAWGKAHGRPMFLGEFGTYEVGDLESRAAWTRAVAREAERHGIAWCYWEFGAGFGVFDREAGNWRESLRSALLDAKQ
jgi:endoglucanase